jgi:signal transduction histidine kinase
MRRRSLFITTIFLFCVFTGVLGVSIYSSLKLQDFQTIQSKAGDLPFRWSQVESATKELLITYEMKSAQIQWLDTYRLFSQRIETFMAAPFTRDFLAKDVDFQISVARVKVHWDIIRNKFKKTNLNLMQYLEDDQLSFERRDSGNVLVNFGQNWATGQYHDPLVDIIASLRHSVSRSDKLFSMELNEVKQHVEREILAQGKRIRIISLLLSTLILGIAGIFVSYHMAGMAHSRETASRYADGLFVEIEERKRSEEKLRSEQRKLRIVLNAMGEGMYIVNRRYEIEYQNTLLDRDYGKELDIPCYEKYLNSERPCPDCYIQETIQSGGIRQVEVALDDGKNYELIFSPFADVDGETKAIVLWYDITERKEMEAEAKRVEHLASIGELAAGVAHEINNPINGIISVAEIIKDQLEEKNEDGTLADRIIDESDRIAKIVQNLLSFSRNRSGNYRPCRLEAILSDALGLVESQMLKEGITISVDVPHDLSPVNGQSQEIQQVFLNLLSNARYALNLKYPERDDNKRLEISGECVENENESIVRMIFYDMGTGIKNELLDQICNPFFSTKPKGQGTGLGLSISHGIMKGHGGRLAFHSVPGEYTKVILTFPLKKEFPSV